jgi:class 3 adenylate cyclase
MAVVSGQPSGTVTLVFTDIEGSTRLLHELGRDAYREVLAEHRRIVRDEYGYTGAYWRSRALLGLAVFDNHQPPRRPG